MMGVGPDHHGLAFAGPIAFQIGNGLRVRD
jgi:hypothetical protein